MAISRRHVILFGGLGVMGAGAAAVPWENVSAKSASRLDDRQMPRPYAAEFTQPPVLKPTSVGIDPDDGARIENYTVTQRAATARMLPRLDTPILGYDGLFPGPTIEVERGTKTTLTVRNQLPATHPAHGHVLATSTHLHGSASLPQYDGYANDVTMPGFKKTYHYSNVQNARSIWYHDHGVHFTALNVYSGLAGQYRIHDELERGLLPQGEFDVGLTITDAMFARNGALGYDDNDHSGLWGDVILVNGVPWPRMRVKRRIYRFRMLNASISRSLRPYLTSGEAMTIVATDGGLMPRAVDVAQWRHAGAERYEVLIDFSKYRAGTRVELRNRSNENNRDYDHTNKIMAFDVVDDPVDTSDPTWNTPPTVLDPGGEVMSLTSKMAGAKRYMRVKRDDRTNLWTLNDKTWGAVIASGYQDVFAQVGLNTVEEWEIENKSGGWFHPMHIHLVDFRILSRNGRAPFPYESGPKDTVYVGEGEKVRLLMRFGPHQGRYMVHCHNLPHEDHDMMTQFRVGLKANAPDPWDPIDAARPELDDD
ncbi:MULTISPECIES: multicopper oxidase family protein [Micrococcaceae]|uniref:multicopper oxidase family protein n=1 Tax=Micrococcaceae TaxID=1268 RepID=UPI0016167E4B|nr:MULTISPECIES: multicopper oxidase family protein [Micrococcaceae]MBB5748497.1 FtsP/CotA-like multicopper oxidase with cupredoxin domain [Micrococcus sp. TA1]HRO30085.1 multicopper oxidase family protein [Citricoccus sp.]HRO93677.1 multicopper oxidase family protein [Citricoccus sp.]